MLRFAMIASVPRLPNGRPDFDPWLFRRQMADVFDVDVGDVALNISILIVARNERILTEARITAAEVFNITVISTSSMFESCDILDPNATLNMGNMSGLIALPPTEIIERNTITEREVYIFMGVFGPIFGILFLLSCIYRRRIKRNLRKAEAKLRQQARDAMEREEELRRQTMEAIKMSRDAAGRGLKRGLSFSAKTVVAGAQGTTKVASIAANTTKVVVTKAADGGSKLVRSGTKSVAFVAKEGPSATAHALKRTATFSQKQMTQAVQATKATPGAIKRQGTMALKRANTRGLTDLKGELHQLRMENARLNYEIEVEKTATEKATAELHKLVADTVNAVSYTHLTLPTILLL